MPADELTPESFRQRPVVVRAVENPRSARASDAARAARSRAISEVVSDMPEAYPELTKRPTK